MTMPMTEEVLPAEAGDLGFLRTVDRSMVHRRALSEVFLTEVVRHGEDGFLAAAQLPPAHPHYGNIASGAALDPLLLLECCRQAETYAAHAFFGVAMDAKFVLREWSMRLSEQALRPHLGPGELTMVAGTSAGRGRVAYRMDLWLSGHLLGEVRMDVGYLPAALYPRVRSRSRGGPPPSSVDLPAQEGVLIAPERVGRVRPVDTLLLDTVLVRDSITGSSVTATVRVPVDNPSMFDHAQDHIPGMVLMEAARQLCLLAAHEFHGREPSRTSVTSLAANFHSYAELDAPVVASVHAGARVVFRQHGVPITEAELGLGELA
jgi:hypothetical protein